MTILAAVLLCLAFHLSTEGTLKVNVASGRFGLRLGRFAFGLIAIRPGRVYYRAQWQRCVV